MIGVKKTGDLLEKLTWGFAIAIFVLTMSTSFVMKDNNRATDDFMDRAKEESGTLPSLDLGGVESEQPAENSLEDLSNEPDSVE